MICVATNFSQMYYPVIRQYKFLETFEALREVKKFALITDFRPEFLAWLRSTFKTIEFIPVDVSKLKLQEQLAQVSSLQYGEFIDLLPELKPEDYVIYIDSDITIQRQFTDVELNMFRASPDATYLSLNARGNGTLTEELAVLNPNPNLELIRSLFGDTDAYACYNTGVIGNCVHNWGMARDIYLKGFPSWKRAIAHKAAVQWFESWLYQTQGFKLFDARSEFVKNIHAHCHEGSAIQFFGLKRDADGYIVRGDVPVLFAHAHLHQSWQHLLVEDGSLAMASVV
jgi:hypothetical protein